MGGHSIEESRDKIIRNPANISPVNSAGYNLLHEGTIALAEIERNGIRINLDYCKEQKRRFDKRIERLHEKLEPTKLMQLWKGEYGSQYSITKTQQLAKILFEQMDVASDKETKTGRKAVDQEVIVALVPQVPELQLVLDIRKNMKARDTYIENLLLETNEDGFLRPFFHLNKIPTFRSSSSGPNFQNIPIRDPDYARLIRSAFIPREGGQILEIDFKGAEVRVSACYNKDPRLIKYVSNPSTDMHGDMAKQIFFLRGKVPKPVRNGVKGGFVFAEFYGSYYELCAPPLWELAKQEGLLPYLADNSIKTQDQFTSHLEAVEKDFWGNRFKVYAQWKIDWYDAYTKQGYFDTYTGFRCQGYMRRNQVINYPVQGSAFHCLLWTLIEMRKWLKKQNFKSLIIGQIHDSMVMDVRPNEFSAIVEKVTELVTQGLQKYWKWIIVPLEIEIEAAPIDKSWFEKAPLQEGVADA